MEHYDTKFQVVIGRQAYNARQLARRAALRGHDANSRSRRVEFHRRKYDDMYREPLTAAQREEILAKTGHVKDADGRRIKRSEASRLRKIAKRLKRMNEGRPIVGPNPLQANLDRQLLEAALTADTATVGQLLDRGAAIDARSRYGRTALINATQNEHTETVRLLLERGAAVEARDNDGETALMVAADFGRTETVGLLLDRRANIEAKNNDGETALMVAARQGHTPTAGMLLDRGADIEARSNGGWTALMYAAHNGHTETVSLLLDRGATREGFRTALMLARDQATTAQLLRNAGRRRTTP